MSVISAVSVLPWYLRGSTLIRDCLACKASITGWSTWSDKALPHAPVVIEPLAATAPAAG